jgi:Protein of unknown function (DUF5661)
MTESRRTTPEEARVGDAIGVDWNRFDLEQFRMGMDVEFEHGSHDRQTDVTHDDPIITGKIALAHMKEFPTTTSVSSTWSAKPNGNGQTSRADRDAIGDIAGSHQGRTPTQKATTSGYQRHTQPRTVVRNPACGKEGVDGSSPSEGFGILPG